MKNFSITQYRHERILTTAQIAEAYQTTEKIVSQNYIRNKEHFVAGKHYFLLEGADLKAFKKTVPHFEEQFKQARYLYLWTKRGAAFHAKTLTTQRAWDFYEELVDFYFEVQEAKQSQQEQMFTKDVQRRCMLNEKLLKPGYWCVVTEMWREAWILEAFQKELKPSSLPDGSCGTKWRNHLKDNKHLQLSKSYQEYLHVPNLQNLVKVWVYPDALLLEFRRWLRVEYAQYYGTKYSPSRLNDHEKKYIDGASEQAKK